MADLKNLDVQDLMDTVNNLDFENVGGWPMPIKVALAIIVLVGAIVVGYVANVSGLNDQLTRLQHKQTSLMQTYETKAYKAKNLDQYKAQLVDMRAKFGELLKQLPKDTEVPGLLEDITHTGEGSGLTINKIKLQSEVHKKFYAELPIDIDVTGTYHGFGNFVSGVAALPRIVTLHNFTIKPQGKKGHLLEMQITAKTYRYVGNADDNQGGE